MDLADILSAIFRAYDHRCEMIFATNWATDIKSARINEAVAMSEIVAAEIRDLYAKLEV
jgi:hypothetical protein